MGSLYFVPFRTSHRELTEEERGIVLDHICRGNGVHNLLVGVTVSIDHVHLILKPMGDLTLSRVLKGIKSASARLVNRASGTIGTVWQKESWDRILRDDREFMETLRQLADNPDKAGLCCVPEEYRWRSLNEELL